MRTITVQSGVSARLRRKHAPLVSFVRKQRNGNERITGCSASYSVTTGGGVPQDYKELGWAQLSANKGNPGARWMLGFIH